MKRMRSASRYSSCTEVMMACGIARISASSPPAAARLMTLRSKTRQQPLAVALVLVVEDRGLVALEVV
jgi:hypothetical protein